MAYLASENPTFAPAFRQVTDITTGKPITVTTSFAHGYVTGTIVRLYVPISWGMFQANHLFAPITVTSDTQFTMPLDSTPFDAFVTPASPVQYPQCVPIGEITSILTAAKNNILPRN